MNTKAESPRTHKWLTWTPNGKEFREMTETEPTKPTEPAFDGFVGTVSEQASRVPPLHDVLKGYAVELYVADSERLFIVADEADAATLGERRGAVYTAAEIDCVVQIEDPSIVAEIHRWKRTFDGQLSAYRGRAPSKRGRD